MEYDFSVEFSALDEFFELLSIKYGFLDVKDDYFNLGKDFYVSLSKAVYEFEDKELSEYYVDMQLPKSEKYLKWFDDFTRLFWQLGLSDSMINEEDAGLRVFYQSAPWENEYYEKLQETNDFWWFLVCMIQKFGSSSEVSTAYETRKVFEEVVIKEKFEGFDLNWFENLHTWFLRNKMMKEYKNSVPKQEEVFNVDFSQLKSVDINNIPEYDLDEYFYFNGDYYDPIEVRLAITASGGLAQSLERQDLEGKVTTASSLLKKKKKNKLRLK